MTVTIPADDFGQIRVFSIPSPMPAGLAEKTPQALSALFGTDALNPDFVDVIDTRDLAGLSLVDYLNQGYDLPADSVDHAALRRIDGPAVLIMSRATAGEAVTLTLAGGVQHVTTCGDATRLSVPDKITSAAATGTGPVGKAPPSNAAMSGRVATIALLVLFALVGLMVWVAS